MDNYSVMGGGPITHSVELYTERLLVQGDVSGPFKRTSDLMNRREPRYVMVHNASIVPVGLSAPPRQVSAPVMVQRPQIHLVAARTVEQGAQPQGQAQGVTAPAREYYVQKTPQPCYIWTDTFIIQGAAHLLQGAQLENLLDTTETFVPITNASIYLISLPNAPWYRDLVIVNKEKIHVMYAM